MPGLAVTYGEGHLQSKEAVMSVQWRVIYPPPKFLLIDDAA
jgi:hypothetical protein